MEGPAGLVGSARLGRCAAAALFELHSAAWATFERGHTPLGRPLAAYPVAMRALLAWGLLHRDEIPAPRARSDAAVATFIVATLGIVADAETGALLRRHSPTSTSAARSSPRSASWTAPPGVALAEGAVELTPRSARRLCDRRRRSHLDWRPLDRTYLPVGPRRAVHRIRDFLLDASRGLGRRLRWRWLGPQNSWGSPGRARIGRRALRASVQQLEQW